MKKRQSLFIILWMVGASVYAQESINYNQQDYEVTITKTIEKILLDGNLNEGIWKTNTSVEGWRKPTLPSQFFGAKGSVGVHRALFGEQPTQANRSISSKL